jgi:hypothetical protein
LKALGAFWSKLRGRNRSGSLPKRTKAKDFVIAFGLFMASILDPKTRVQTEMLDKKQTRDRVDPGKENA